MFRTLGVILLCLTPFDWIVLGRVMPETLAIRVIWAGLFFGATVPRFPVAARQWTLTIGSVLLHGAMIHVTGGADSRHVALWPLLPMLAAFLMNDDLEFTWVTGGVGGLVGALQAWQWDRGTDAILVQVLVMATSTLLGYLGGRHLNRMRRAERDVVVERARREHRERVAMAERRQRQAERLAVMGQVAANIAHELRNPLASVRGNLELVHAGHLEPARIPDADLADAFADARRGLDRIHQISEDLRRFARDDSGELGACRLGEAVDTAVRLAKLKVKRFASIQVELDDRLPPVHANGRKLSQVVLNLLVNAGDALEETLEVGMGTIRVHATATPDTVQLAVEDDGPGVPEELLPRLFEPFFTTKDPEHGTGLGLALSREIIEGFGGTIGYEERPGGGARFVIRLQAACGESFSSQSA